MTFGRNIPNYLEWSLYATVFMQGLLFITLSSLKLHTENNEYMLLLLTGSVTRNCSYFL